MLQFLLIQCLQFGRAIIALNVLLILLSVYLDRDQEKSADHTISTSASKTCQFFNRIIRFWMYKVLFRELGFLAGKNDADISLTVVLTYQGIQLRFELLLYHLRFLAEITLCEGQGTSSVPARLMTTSELQKLSTCSQDR